MRGKIAAIVLLAGLASSSINADTYSQDKTEQSESTGGQLIERLRGLEDIANADAVINDFAKHNLINIRQKPDHSTYFDLIYLNRQTYNIIDSFFDDTTKIDIYVRGISQQQIDSLDNLKGEFNIFRDKDHEDDYINNLEYEFGSAIQLYLDGRINSIISMDDDTKPVHILDQIRSNENRNVVVLSDYDFKETVRKTNQDRPIETISLINITPEILR